MVDTPIVSESLQKTFRDNFPSQVNSGRDLHVSDVIIPTVDFSSTAGTSGLSVGLQEAIDFNVTTFDISNTSSTIVNTTGFWRVRGSANSAINSTSSVNTSFILNDGSSTKTIFDFVTPRIQNQDLFTGNVVFDFVVLLATGVSLEGSVNTNESRLVGSCRQVAALDGTLNNPSGYTGQ